MHCIWVQSYDHIIKEVQNLLRNVGENNYCSFDKLMILQLHENML